MVYEGQKVTHVREFTHDDIEDGIAHFPATQDTLPALELENGVALFPAGDSELNIPGKWPVDRNDLEHSVGLYILGFKQYGNPQNGRALTLVLGQTPPPSESPSDEPPSQEDVEIEITPIEQRPGERARWVGREPNESKNPEADIPKMVDIIEQYMDDELSEEEYREQMAAADAAYSDNRYRVIDTYGEKYERISRRESR